uniref:Uncharacterized protein n=5 Tax=unclassified Prevotella TaxID=2638335 RepID=A0AB33JGG7_9BACT
MKLHQLFQAYEFDEIMPVINDMFPGTSKYREPLETAYNIILQMKPVPNKATIRYKIMDSDTKGEQYMGAEDSAFMTTWEVCLGKDVSKGGGIDLSNAEILANCLVNMCFISKYPKEFEAAHKKLLK